MKTFIVVLLSLTLAACATKSTVPTVEDTTKAAFMDRAVAAANAPLFKLTCPATGCVIGSLELGNPQGASQLADLARVALTPQPSTGEKVALAFVEKGFGALGIGLIANGVKSFASSMFGSQTAIATGGFAALKDTAAAGFSVNGQIASRIPQPGAVNTFTIGGQGVIGNGQLSTVDRHDVMITDRHDIVNINPSPKVCTVSATGVQTCTGG